VDDAAVKDLVLQVEESDDGDVAELENLTDTLRSALLELDVDAVNLVAWPQDPVGAKGFGTIAGGLLVRLGNSKILRTVINAIRDWAGRTSRTVEVVIGQDRLKLTGVTSEQQDKIIEAWIARHSA
jgi:hypothetical protein